MGVRLLVRSCWTSRSEEDAVYEFDQTRILLGRGRGADVRLPHRSVSIRHATIELDGSRYSIVDHSTTNGTKVQGARIVPGRPKPLRDGDRIELGGFAVVFTAAIPVGRSSSAERTASLARRLAREALDAEDEKLRPFITVLNGPGEGAEVVLSAPPSAITVGRGEECDLTIDDADASREHAAIEVRLDGVYVVDRGSKNGVLVKGKRVETRMLGDRDELTIGATVLRFEDPAAAVLSSLDEGEDDEVEPPSWEDIEKKDEPVLEEATLADDAPEQGPLDIADTRPAPRRASRSSVAPADMVIYVLASVVFALSILGLVWLLGSG